MKKRNKTKSYTETFVEYQSKQYLPGYYVGSKTHPVLKAKTKAGGYLMLIVGIFLFCFYLFQLINNLSSENIVWIGPIGFSILLIIVGFKFIKHNFHK